MTASETWVSVSLLYGACALAVYAMYADARAREIPQWPMILLPSLSLVAWSVPEALNASPWESLACGAAGLVAGYGFFTLGWLGGGDGKLLAGLAMWLGPRDAGLWLLGTALIGLLLILVARSRLGRDFRSRGIPFVWAMAPPGIALLAARAVDLSP